MILRPPYYYIINVRRTKFVNIAEGAAPRLFLPQYSNTLIQYNIICKIRNTESGNIYKVVV